MKNNIKNAKRFIKKIDKKREDDWSNDTELLAKYFVRYAKKCGKAKNEENEDIKDEDVDVEKTETEEEK